MNFKKTLFAMMAVTALLLSGCGSSVKTIQLTPSVSFEMVRLPNGCWFGKTEVTQAQWEAVMGENPSRFKGADKPVENISWDDCQNFLKKLNARPEVKKSGLMLRLPTEKEWEYACRAGTTGKWRYCLLSDGKEITEDSLGEIAWFHENSRSKTHPVGHKKPNAFGLYDMHGNVWEWTQTAGGENRVYRGGCFLDKAVLCMADRRSRINPGFRSSFLGFRLCASGRAD